MFRCIKLLLALSHHHTVDIFGILTLATRKIWYRNVDDGAHLDTVDSQDNLSIQT